MEFCKLKVKIEMDEMLPVYKLHCNADNLFSHKKIIIQK